MRKLSFILFITQLTVFVFPQNDENRIREENVSNYLESIRNNEAFLRKFFQSMPKGGDLHHHYSGSIYAETYLKFVESKNAWINLENFEISLTLPQPDKGHWSKISQLKELGQWESIKIKLYQTWSVKYYVDNGFGLPPDEQFFSTFSKFSVPKDSTVEEGLKELVIRAKYEKTSYIETMFSSIKFDTSFCFENKYKAILIKMQENRDPSIQDTLFNLYQKLTKNKYYLRCADSFNNTLVKQTKELSPYENDCLVRYLNYVNRTTDPVSIFKNLLVSFESDNKSDLIVGVNIVAPENNDIALRDYWLHMQMFKFFHKKYPGVKYSMHAGELTLGLVKPEELSWHIGEALFEASARRIGHGVDIMYETYADSILRYMQENKIAVEINLSSNDFILGISGSRHPITIYNTFHIPIVICTDDAGILRTDLTQQYVILAKEYPQIPYSEIKKYVYNSIEFSFLDEKNKKLLREKLINDFRLFEEDIIKCSERLK